MSEKMDKRLSMGRKKEDVIFPVASARRAMPGNYFVFLSELKERIRQERLRVVMAK